MRIALKAHNGKYVCAEQGGGIKYDGNWPNQTYGGPYPAPLYANRDSVGAWETFELETFTDGSVSIKTNNGNYLSAEEGGAFGISTDRKEANAWEHFWPDGQGFRTANDWNFLCAELGSGSDYHINATRTTVGIWESFETIYLDKPAWPPIEKLKNWRGQFCALPMNLPYSPNGILFTPGYVVYDEDTRYRIRQVYKESGWTHFPLNLTNHSSIYRDHYPDWDDSNINTYLTELLKDGIIPVGYTMGDSDKVINCKADPSLVPIALGRWEDSAPLVKPALDENNTFHLVRQKYPDSLIYWHNPPYQGAPFVSYADWGLPNNDPGINAKVWRYMVHECGVTGLMFQGKAWENDAQDSIGVLQSFTERLRHGVNGWPIADVIDYEETAYYMFNMGGDYDQAVRWTEKIRNAQGVECNAGYCNG